MSPINVHNKNNHLFTEFFLSREEIFFSTASLSINVLLAVFEFVDILILLSESFRDPL